MPVTARSNHCFRRRSTSEPRSRRNATSSPESSPSAAAGWSATCSASDVRTGSGRTSGATSPAMPWTIPSSRATSMPRQQARWVEAGLARHFFYVPALPELVDPWFRLSFGASSALAMRETSPEAPVDADVAVRESTPDDVRAAAQLDRLMGESMLPSPSFSQHEPDDEPTLVEEWADTWERAGDLPPLRRRARRADRRSHPALPQAA